MEDREELTMEAAECLRLDEEMRLFPGSDHPGQKHQEQPVRLPRDGAFDLSTQDDQLVSQQHVFRQQFGFAFRQISKRPK